MCFWEALGGRGKGGGFFFRGSVFRGCGGGGIWGPRDLGARGFRGPGVSQHQASIVEFHPLRPRPEHISPQKTAEVS